MSTIESVYELQHNPFIYGSYLASFYEMMSEGENTILFSPLVIPICSHPYLGEKLSKATRRSSLLSIFSERTQLIDLPDHIRLFKQLTFESLQYCLVNDWLTIDEKRLNFLSNISGVDRKFKSFRVVREAKYLGMLFNGKRPVEVFNFLGVSPYEVYDFRNWHLG